MTITSFENGNIKRIREVVQEALSEIESKLNIELKMGGIKYSDYDFSVTLNGSVLLSNEEKEKKEKEDFALIAPNYGFRPEDYGKRFHQGTKTYTLYRFAPKNRKYPVLAQDEMGRQYKFSPASVKLLLRGVV